MTGFLETGKAIVNFNTLNYDAAFASDSANDDATLSTIAQVNAETGYLLDPHTAVGVDVGRKFRSPDVPLVCLATAHPAKFDDVIAKTLPNLTVTHDKLEALRNAETRKSILPADAQVVKQFIHDFQLT